MSSSAAKKPVYLRGLPSDVVREAKAAAAQRGVTLAGFVAETLARAVRQREPSAETTADLTSDMRWYEKNRERIAREHAGEYIAIIDRKLVDHDADFEALAERVFEREGSRNIFMPLVGADAGGSKRKLHVPSPRQSRRR
jgi:hypothetical protein